MGRLSPAGDMLEPGLRAISSALLSARKAARGLPGFPGDVPATLDEAYRVQEASRAAWPDEIGGWKVGGVPPAYLDRFDARSLAGPIWQKSIRVAGAGLNEMPVYDGGFAAIEPEFVFRLGTSREEDRMFIGAEIASSPVPAINDYGPAAVICDFGNNNGLLLGPEVPDWRNRHAPIAVRTDIDGKEVGAVSAGFEPALDALAFLVALSQDRGFELPEGTLVSSGAITGVHEAPVGAVSTVDFGDLGRFDLKLIPATPL